MPHYNETDAGIIGEYVVDRVDGRGTLVKDDGHGNPLVVARRGLFFVRDSETGEINP